MPQIENASATRFREIIAKIDAVAPENCEEARVNKLVEMGLTAENARKIVYEGPDSYNATVPEVGIYVQVSAPGVIPIEMRLASACRGDKS